MDLYSSPKPLPDLLDYTVEDEPSFMEVRSDTIEPLNSGVYTKRFRLEPFGFLAGESVLLFKLQGSSGTDKQRLNVMSGGLAAIATARMSVGDTIIQETRSFEKVSFSDYVVKRDRDSLNKYHSHYWGNAFHSDVCPDATGPLALLENAGTGQVVMGDDSGIYFGVPGAGTNADIKSQAITTVVNDNYQVGIRLDELFPCLKGQTLPLFLFDEYRIYIDIDFNTSDKYANDITTTGATVSYVAAADAIVPAEVKLQVDYLIFPSKVLDETRKRTEAQGGLELYYPSTKVIEKVLPAAVAGTQQDAEFRIGASDQEVHSLTLLKELTTASGATFDGRNRSLMCGMVSDGMPSESYQVEVNGIPMYPFFKSSKASQHDQAEYALGDTMKMERCFYYTDDNDIASELTPKTSGLQGTYSDLAISLRSGNPTIWGGGTVIGNYPINFRYRRTAKASSAEMNATTGSMDLKFLMKVSSKTRVQSTPAGMLVETVGV